MNIIYKVFNFSKNFKYYIDIYNNFIFLIFNKKNYILKIPAIFFIKNQKNNFNFLFLNKFYYISFIKHLFNYYNKFFSLYHFRLKLKGLGYRIFQLSKFLLKIFYNRSNFFYIHIPSCIFSKYRTRRLCFFSINLNILKVLVTNILLLKEFVIYRLGGLFYPRQIILIKPGKNKYR